MENYDTGNYGDAPDFEGQQQAVARALRKAQSLAETAYAGVTRPRANPLHYVANYLSQRNADEELSAAEKKAAEFGATKERKVTDLVTQISTPGTKRVLKQTLGGDDAPLNGQNVAPPTEAQAPLDPVEENQRQMGLAMTLGRIDPKMAAPFIASGAAFPEKMATLKATQEARAEENRRRSEDRVAELDMRLQDRSLDRASREQMAAEGRALRQSLADSAKESRQGNQDLQRELLQARIDNLTKKTEQVGVMKPTRESAAAEKARHEAALGLSAIRDAIAEIDNPAAKNALGPINILPNAVRQYTNPKGVAARAAVSNIGSMKLHDRSGAAVTVSEFPRLVPFIPLVTDKPEAAKVKLNKMADEYARMQEEWGKSRGATDAYPEDGSGPASPARRKVYNPATGRLE